MSPESLREYSRKQLEHLARSQGVPNIRQLRKQDLIHALTSTGSTSSADGRKNHRSAASLQSRPEQRSGLYRDQTTSRRPDRPSRAAVKPSRPVEGPEVGDEIQIDVLDSCWLRVSWQISRTTRDRAVAAMGPGWHQAVPVLRLEDVTPDDDRDLVANGVDQVLPPGTSVWFLRVADVERTYRLSLGYRMANGRWHQVIRSRPLVPARVQPVNLPGQNSADGSPASLKAPASATTLPTSTRYGMPEKADANTAATPRTFLPPRVPGAPPLDVEMELIIRGTTDPDAHLLIDSRPLFVESGGRFRHQLPVVTGRQVLPIVATSADGGGERTVVLAFEFNTRELEPRVFDDAE